MSQSHKNTRLIHKVMRENGWSKKFGLDTKKYKTWITNDAMSIDLHYCHNMSIPHRKEAFENVVDFLEKEGFSTSGVPRFGLVVLVYLETENE